MLKKYFYIIGICVLLYSCHNPSHKLSFNIKRQILYSCDSNPIYHLTIDNDSITKKGFPFEGGVILSWNDSINNPPKEINILHVSSNYLFSKGGIETNIKYFKLKPNCSYLIEKWGEGKPSFYIRVWTNSTGSVYKTTHPQCGIESLNNPELPTPR